MNNFFYRNFKKEYPVISDGHGVWLKDLNNTTYLDGSSGAIVANIGYGLDEINEAINEQFKKIAFVHSSQFVSQPALELSERLIEIAPAGFKPGGRVYFCSGGSEATETALKMARAYFVESGLYQKKLVISRKLSYHGSTLGALSATGHPARRRPYLPMLPENIQISPSNPYRCPCGCAGTCSSEDCGRTLADELEAAICRAGEENVMAFIAEPVVGAALGAAVPHPGYFKRIKEICKKAGVLLIADEVMTGLGRTGRQFGLSHFEAEADLIVLGKGLSAGYMPLGAVLASASIAHAFEKGSGVFEHGFTYSAHPPSCAAGLAVLRYLEKHKLLERVTEMEAKLKEGLESLAEHEFVGDIRGKGFLYALEFVVNKENKTAFASDLRFSQKLASEAFKAGLILYPGSGCVDGVKGDQIMIAPAFNISQKELDELFNRLDHAIKKASAAVPSTSRI